MGVWNEKRCNKYDTDKNSFFHNYTRQYTTLLHHFRDKQIKFLEIGVYNGCSIQAFRKAFKNSNCILGLDIDNRCKKYEDINLSVPVRLNIVNNYINIMN